MGSAIFDWHVKTLIPTLQALFKAEVRAGDGAELELALDVAELPRLLKAIIKCAGEVLKARREIPFNGIVPQRSGGFFDALGHFGQTPLGILHRHARWRDLPRFLWVPRAVELANL